MIQSIGYAAQSPQSPLAPYRFERRDPQPHDVVIDILYCGVCHSDLHVARSEWGQSRYPCVPGHEIVGRVARVGAAVTRFRVGDLAAVGCMVDSCRTCPSCREGEEQFCEQGPVMTYGGLEKHTGGITYGGYSSNIVVDEAYTLRVPAGLDPAATAPLLCAGITTWSPLRHWKVGPGQQVGVFGLGGLGHMALKLARALGAHVVLFTTSPDKEADARRLGAHDVVLSRDKDAMKAWRNRLDFIIDTVSAPHDINAALALLKRDGTLCQVGLPPAPLPVNVFALTGRRRSLAGSFIGGIAETQEMLDFCAAHGIASDIELIPVQRINEAYERLVRGDVKYRFVIDMASLATDAPA
ncbi:MAG TPA: NAD(P)-dependent alcohol dehydrogenase [Moraxellaceae bacterium]|nr:NAD(P)-dependent alcohol dehydrogenase [Moraxellaceae bacterium]